MIGVGYASIMLSSYATANRKYMNMGAASYEMTYIEMVGRVQTPNGISNVTFFLDCSATDLGNVLY